MLTFSCLALTLELMGQPPDQPSTSETVTFEQAMTRLESLVDEMENGRLPLEDLVSRFDEGIRLSQVCGQRLEEARHRVEIITRNAEAAPAVAPFDPASPPVEEAENAGPAPARPVVSKPAVPDEITLF